MPTLMVSVPLSSLTDRALLELIATRVVRIEEKMDDIQTAIDEQTAEITNLTTVTAGVVQLINDWATRIEAQADDPAQVRANTAAMRAAADSIATAVAANTPAAPEGDGSTETTTG